MPLHAGKGRSVAAALGRSTEYVENPEKTDGGELISAYACDPLIADAEFLFSKRQYAMITGRNQGDRDIIAYHLRQSFKPGEIDPAKANQIGYDLAMSLTKGKHAFLVCTHIDRKHIHSHIIFNSTSLDCTRKFKNCWNSSFIVRRISDQLCLQNGLSVIEEPKPSRGHYGACIEGGRPPTQRDKLRDLIDAAFEKSPHSMEALLAALRDAGCEVKQGKHLSIKPPDAKKFLRCKSLGENYTEDVLLERVQGKRVVVPTKAPIMEEQPTQKTGLQIDLQRKIQQASSPGYERMAKLINLKDAAKTLVTLQEKGLDDYALLEEKTVAAVDAFRDRSAKIKAVEKRMEEISTLQKHIGNYCKTLDTYRKYHKSGYSKKFRAKHETDVLLHQAAKRHFDSLGLEKLPTIKTLKREYAVLLTEKKKLYQGYRDERENMLLLQRMKGNVDRILGASIEENARHRTREETR